MVSVLIPARGGSSRVPNKNLQTLGGMPLVEVSVFQAEALFPGAQVVVSTDSERIADVVHCEVLRRPEHLCTNTARTIDVIHHHLPELKGDWIALFQPTNPFRNLNSIRTQLEQVELSNFDSFFTAFPFHGFLYDATGKRLNSKGRVMSQEQRGVFKEDGAFYLFNRNVEVEQDWIFGRTKILDGIDLPDINTLEDLENARRAWSADWLC